MRRLLTAVFLGTLLIGGSLLLARSIGAGQTSPYAAFFTQADGSPCVPLCLFGLEPGVTTFDEAIELLPRHPLVQGLTRQESGNEIVTSFDGPEFSIFIARIDRSPVLAVALVVFKRSPAGALSPQMGDMVSLFGPPDGVSASRPDSANVEAYYPARHLTITVTRAQSTLDTPLAITDRMALIALYSRDAFLEIVDNPEVAPTIKSWNGFVSVRRYLNRPSIYFSPY